MSVLSAVLDATRSGAVEVVDLTTPLQESTPILELPPPFANTSRFRLEELSRYDEKGPGWYWNDIHTGEHTGTHLDAPVHWVTGKDLLDVSQAPLSVLVGPAAVIDMTAEAEKDADFLLEVEHVQAWQAEHGPHTPGVSPECARWLAEQAPIAGFGVETVGTDAGAAHSFDPVFPCHSLLLGANKWGLTSLRGLERLPVTGAVLIVCPLPIVGGSGSPTRVLALVER